MAVFQRAVNVLHAFHALLGAGTSASAFCCFGAYFLHLCSIETVGEQYAERRTRIESPRVPYPVYRHLQYELQDIFHQVVADEPGGSPNVVGGPVDSARYIII